MHVMPLAKKGRIYTRDKGQLCFQLPSSLQRCLSSGSEMLLSAFHEHEFSSTLHRNTETSPSHLLPAARFVPAKNTHLNIFASKMISFFF